MMRFFRQLPIGMLCLLAAGCQWDVRSVPAKVLEGDNAGNYKRVFGSPPPEDVNIANSVVVDYAYRINMNTTDDWEFELLAPRPWIARRIHEWHLFSVEPSSWQWKWVEQRQARRGRAWYAPKPTNSYEVYRLGYTSIPYVHMLVEKQAEPDGRYRVFLSKH